MIARAQVLIDDNCIDMDATQVRVIKDMINGVKPGGSEPCRGFLYEIVANKRNGIDVDKVQLLFCAFGAPITCSSCHGRLPV